MFELNRIFSTTNGKVALYGCEAIEFWFEQALAPRR